MVVLADSGPVWSPCTMMTGPSNYFTFLTVWAVVASSPGPSPKERSGTHYLCMREISRYVFRKKLRALSCPYVEDSTNQEYRAFFDIYRL